MYYQCEEKNWVKEEGITNIKKKRTSKIKQKISLTALKGFFQLWWWWFSR